MFKNAILYRINTLPVDSAGLLASISNLPFTPCDAYQEKSIGWIPPRDREHGALVEVVNGQWIAKLMIETRSVPASAVDKKLAELVKCMESEGRKIGKKGKAALKDDIKAELLPRAFAKELPITVWIDPTAMLLVIFSSSQKHADDVVDTLVNWVEGFGASMIDTASPPSASMAVWLTEQYPPKGFSVDRECELNATDESKASIKYGNHPLDIDEVVANINAGKLPTKLAMTWGERVSFVLTEGMQIKRIALLDVNIARTSGLSDTESDDFDADVTLVTSELRRLIPDLINALGGERLI